MIGKAELRAFHSLLLHSPPTPFGPYQPAQKASSWREL